MSAGDPTNIPFYVDDVGQLHSNVPCRCAGHNCDEVPPGYWDRLGGAIRYAGLLPEQDKSNDPEPLF